MKIVKFLVFFVFYTLILLYFTLPRLGARPDLIFINLNALSKDELNKDEFHCELNGSDWFLRKDGNISAVEPEEVRSILKDENSTVLFGIYSEAHAFYR